MAHAVSTITEAAEILSTMLRTIGTPFPGLRGPQPLGRWCAYWSMRTRSNSAGRRSGSGTLGQVDPGAQFTTNQATGVAAAGALLRVSLKELPETLGTAVLT